VLPCFMSSQNRPKGAPSDEKGKNKMVNGTEIDAIMWVGTGFVLVFGLLVLALVALAIIALAKSIRT